MTQRLNVLVAEDSQIDMFLLQRALDQTGVAISARFVGDGQEAVDYMDGVGGFSDRNMHPLPSVILLDLKMPRLNGFDVLQWLKSHSEYRTTPVIIFSGSDDHGDVNRAYSLGASSYMVKPGTTGELPNLVRTLDSYWRQYAKLPAEKN